MQALQQAVQLHQQGRFDRAEHCYKAILAAQPNHFDAKHLLGFSDISKVESAALKLKTNSAAALSNFGLVLEKLGRPADALASYDKALALKSDSVEVHWNQAFA